MSESPAPDEGRRAYAVRLSLQARQDITEAALRLAELGHDAARAQTWSDNLYGAIGGLASGPRAHAVAEWETRRFGRETRRMIYRPSAGSAAYRVLFTVADEGPDGPVVTILHVRHASRKPLTRQEANAILENQ